MLQNRILAGVILVVAYLVVYGIITGIWNFILTVICAKRQEKLIERDDGISVITEYQIHLTESWMIKFASNIVFLPMYNVIVMLLWPLYVPCTIVTALYYVFRYLRVPEEEEEEVEAIEEA